MQQGNPSKIKLTYVISDISKMIALEWIIDFINHDKFLLSFIFINEGGSEIEDFVKQHNLPFIRLSYTSKKDLIPSILKARSFLKKMQTDVVHCHLFNANLIGLTAAKIAGIKRRIYTRHHSTYHHDYFPKAVWLDRAINFLSSNIIAISEVVKKVLLEKEFVTPEKVSLINHGFILKEFSDVSEENVIAFKRKYDITEKDFIVGVVARYTWWKGIQYTIAAFKKILLTKPEAKLLIANSHGNDEIKIRELLSTIPSDRIIEVKYERNMGALYKSMNVYVHVPINRHCEAFGQTYVEALAAKTPSVFTLSGIASEFINHNQNAIVVPFENTDAIVDGIMCLTDNSSLKSKIVQQGFDDVSNKFAFELMLKKLEDLYLKK